MIVMDDAEKTPKIYGAISSVMSNIGAIEKEKTNSSQHFKYRGVDDVMNALQPELVANHIFVVPEVLEHKREERSTKGGGCLIYSILKMKYSFYAEDGSNISAVVIGEGMDSGDKSSNKAMSVAFKYACFQVFCIPTEEMKDPDADAQNDVLSRQQEKEKKQQQIIDLCTKNGTTREEAENWMKRQAKRELHEITISQLDKMLEILEKKEVKNHDEQNNTDGKTNSKPRDENDNK